MLLLFGIIVIEIQDDEICLSTIYTRIVPKMGNHTFSMFDSQSSLINIGTSDLFFTVLQVPRSVVLSTLFF